MVAVPEGFDSVNLQVLTSPVKGAAAPGAATMPAWNTVASKRMNGARGAVRFVLPKLTPRRNLRVYGLRPISISDTLLEGPSSFPPESGEAESATTTSDSVTLSLSGSTTSLASNNLSAASPVRTVEESDIWKKDGDRLYFYNSLRGLQSFDISHPDEPVLLGTLRLPGAGEQMYLLDAAHVVLLKNNSYSGWWWTDWYEYNYGYPGLIFLARPQLFIVNSIAAGSMTTFSSASNAFASSSSLTLAADPVVVQNAVSTASYTAGGSQPHEIVIADVRAGAPKELAHVAFEGYLQESRLVGNVLYVASNTYTEHNKEGTAEWGLQLTSFDLADPAHPVERAKIFIGGWATAVQASDRYFFSVTYGRMGRSESLVRLVDISDPTGLMKRVGEIELRGYVADKFKMHQSGETFAVVSSAWNQLTPSGTWTTANIISTFSLADPLKPAALGSLEVAPGESLYATRFDGDRVYVVTAVRVDPLHIIDLSDPSAPKQLGELTVPGFSTYIEPLGDRLVTIGYVGWRPSVALYDVSNPAAPKQLSAITLGDDSWTYSEALYNEKAFSVLPEENLIMIPISGYYGGATSAGVQMIDLKRDKLVKRGLIKGDLAPRRATVHKNRILSISSSRLMVVDASDRDQPVITAELRTTWPVQQVVLAGEHLVQITQGGSGLNQQPLVIVTGPTTPDAPLDSLELPPLQVLAATSRHGVLYVLQALTSNGYLSLSSNAPLKVSSIDVAHLPKLKLLATTEVKVKAMSSTYTAKPVWVNDRTLVFATQGSAWYQPRITTSTPVEKVENNSAATATVTLSGSLLYWPRYYPTLRTQDLFAFDVTDPAKLKLASQLSFGAEQSWDAATVVPTVNDKALLGFKALSRYSISDPQTEEDKARAAEDARTANRHYVTVIDYSDSSAPVVSDKKVNIPGELRAVSADGQFLYTMGQPLKQEESGVTVDGKGTVLHVSAFDGESAHLRDQLPLESRYHPLAFSGDAVFLLKPQPRQIWVDPTPENTANYDYRYEDNPKLSELVTLKPNAGGQLKPLDSVTLAHEIRFALINGLAVLTTNDDPRAVRLLDARDPAKLIDFGIGEFKGIGSASIKNSAADPERGLWVPLGEYGVEGLVFE